MGKTDGIYRNIKCKFCGTTESTDMGYRAKWSITVGDEKIKEERPVCIDCAERMIRVMQNMGGR